MGADLDKASRAEWLASEFRADRKKVQRSASYAVRFPKEGGELKDTHLSEERKIGKTAVSKKASCQMGARGTYRRKQACVYQGW